MRGRAALLAAMVTVPVVAACGGGSSSTQSYCDSARSAKASLALLNQLGTGNAAQPPSVDRLKSSVAAATQAVDNMDSQAPAEIASDLHLVRNLLDKLHDAVKNVSSTQDFLTALISVASSFGQDAQSKLTAATQHVAAYTKTHCGVDLNAVSSSSTP